MKFVAALLAGVSLADAYTVTSAKQFMKKNIDPIVRPGQYNSHMHSFFGSDSVNISTTTSEELQAGCATAENPNDFSSYWFPTLYKVNSDGSRQEVPVYRFSAYYVNIEDAEIAIPQNYRAVVGNAAAKSQADVEAQGGQEWFCEFDDPEPNKDPAAFPSKGCSVRLQTLLLFHDCVNPETLESTYSGTQHWVGDFKPANRCPAGMFRMPRLRFSIRFEMRDILSEGWEGEAPLELACGPSFCFHGDFINGWLPEAAENMLLANEKTVFKGVDGPLGAYNAGPVCGDGKAVDSDPSNGTSDYEESLKMLAAAANDVSADEAPATSAASAASSKVTATATLSTEVAAPTSTRPPRRHTKQRGSATRRHAGRAY